MSVPVFAGSTCLTTSRKSDIQEMPSLIGLNEKIKFTIDEGQGSQGSLLFVTYTIIQSIISSEMQVELKKNTP